MVSLTVEETVKEDEDNYVEQRHYSFPVVIEDAKKYIGVRDDGSYRIFDGPTVRALENPSGEISDGSGLIDPPLNVIEVYTGEYGGIIHGDLDSI